jgi:hypothetical protein
MIGRSTWGMQFDRCWLCGKPEGIGRFLETHEIARGVHRSKGVAEPCCWMRVCSVCHDTLAGMTIAQQLALKWLNDSENYDRVLVNRIRDRADNAVSEAEVLAELEKLI